VRWLAARRIVARSRATGVAVGDLRVARERVVLLLQDSKLLKAQANR